MGVFCPLSTECLESILHRLPQLRIGVIGDLFLDRYLDLDAGLTEVSLETGLDAYQVVDVRSSPGAAGTVINNLVALGVGQIFPIAVLGDDGEGYELRQALDNQRIVDPVGLLVAADRRTPTYTKPMLREEDASARELNRLDIKNRRPMPEPLEARIKQRILDLWPRLDAVVVLDQVSEADCGVITAAVREQLGELAASEPGKFVLADSRKRIGLFRGVCLKPNRHEALQGAGLAASETDEDLESAADLLAGRTGASVFCTDGPRGILIACPQGTRSNARVRVPAYPVHGPIDTVGAGDSTSAGIVCAMASGATIEAAASFGNLVASITVQQLGTTGTASASQVRERWRSLTG